MNIEEAVIRNVNSSAWGRVWHDVHNSVCHSVGDSVNNSVWYSTRDSTINAVNLTITNTINTYEY